MFGPSFLWLGLAFSSPGGNWPFLLASEGEVRHSFLEWRVWPFLDLALGVKVGPPFSEWVGARLSGLVFGPSFSRWGTLALSFLGFLFAPSFWLALSSRGVVVGLLEVVFGPSLLGLAFSCCGRGSPFPRWLAPSFSGLSFFGWELVLSFWCGSWPFLSWGVNFCPPFLASPFSGCGGWPFLLVVGVWAFLSGVRAGPPFSGFGLALARVSHGGGLFLLSVGVRPPFWEWWLALPSWGRVWPAGIGPSLLWWRFAIPSLSGGLALFGLGRSEGCSCLLGKGWPSPFGVGVWPFLLEVLLLALPFRGWGWLVILRVGIGPVFLVWVLAFPSCPSFLLSEVPIPSWNGGWPFAMKVGPAVWGWKSASFSAFPSRGRGFALPSGGGAKLRKAPEKP